ncbi:hypothetical protein GGTG_08578 [Gaeumannomyces tritici R3-111a-1]|uniref:Uncharacterized protein n=1 Tax=Gaeumannomyces tritici (strain R3-111a-1) TaxID=644352 RepID=J3P4Z2_GAET3|nr:hypothetical protein GGTG_08578 [Gaeumannomyces tritici R3-111a-1]EJT74740.1 hypothetical protein GGTG_08578 [Gaeumannomyces tritici R3-111a-1]
MIVTASSAWRMDFLLESTCLPCLSDEPNVSGALSWCRQWTPPEPWLWYCPCGLAACGGEGVGRIEKGSAGKGCCLVKVDQVILHAWESDLRAPLRGAAGGAGDIIGVPWRPRQI